MGIMDGDAMTLGDWFMRWTERNPIVVDGDFLFGIKRCAVWRFKGW